MDDLMTRLVPLAVSLSLFASLIVSVCPPALGQESNASLEEIIAWLEGNLSYLERELDVALRRTTLLLDDVDRLEHKIGQLEKDLNRALRYAIPSAPPGFSVERVRQVEGGNYTATLRWESNPSHEEVDQYVVWVARKGEEYVAGASVNQTEGKIMKAEVGDLREGEEIVFKIFAKNAAGQGSPGHREITISGGYAPVLMSRIKIFGIVVAVLVVVVVVISLKSGRLGLRGN
jgi:hypothetical protein